MSATKHPETRRHVMVEKTWQKMQCKPQTDTPKTEDKTTTDSFVTFAAIK